MTLPPELAQLPFAQALGAAVVSASPIAGGDIDRALRAELRDGRRVFVKIARDGNARRLAVEAAGLAWLAEASSSLGVPAPLAVIAEPAALVLPWIEPGKAGPKGEEQLGRGLAELHRAGAPRFGCARFGGEGMGGEDLGGEARGWLATLEVDNTESDDWSSFFGERRLLHLALAAHARRALSAGTVRRIEALVQTLDDRVGPKEPPARLHGDLWGGNAMFDAQGKPHIFDPCAYGGHREVDLAMMRLFGGFAERTFEAYDEALPLAPDHHDRVPLYQLLPLLAHCALFGSSWSPQVEEALTRIRA